MNSNTLIYKNECLNEEIINLSYYTQINPIIKPIVHIKNITNPPFKNILQSANTKNITDSGFFIKFTE